MSGVAQLLLRNIFEVSLEIEVQRVIIYDEDSLYVVVRYKFRKVSFGSIYQYIDLSILYVFFLYFFHSTITMNSSYYNNNNNASYVSDGSMPTVQTQASETSLEMRVLFLEQKAEKLDVVLMQCKIHVSTHETSTVKYSTSAC